MLQVVSRTQWNFNNFETLQMSPDGKDLSHIASEITSGRKMDENGEG
jgi:hypothetical protein